MKKHISKRITALLMAMLMVIGLMPVAVSAAVDPWLIDMDKKGDITLIKEAPKLDEDGNPTNESEGVGNVIFHYWKVADIAQVKNDEGKIVVAYTNLDDKLITEMGAGAPVVDFTIDSNDYYYATTLQKAIDLLYALGKPQGDLKTLIEGVGVEMTPTEDGLDSTGQPDPSETPGKTEVKNLAVGLYLFVETEWPSEIIRPCVPFFVSMPSNSTVDVDENEIEYDQVKWLYEITAKPKNEKQTINVDKWILNDNGGTDDLDPSNDTLSKGEDYQIGDTVPYRIEADIPPSIANLKTYTIGDQLSAGLTLDEIGTVYVVPETGAPKKLTVGTDYKITFVTTEQVDVIDNDGTPMGKSNFAIEFVPKSLDGYKAVYVEYTAILNEKALIYPSGNPNHVSLNYSKNTGDNEGGLITVKPKTPEPVVYTYKVKVTKELESPAASNPFDGVEFKLQDINGTDIPLNELDEDDDPSTKEYKYIVSEDGTGTAKITVDANGVAEIIGLNAGQYQLVEVGTAKGHMLLANPIIINIHAVFKGETFVAKADGPYFQIEADKVYYVNGKEIDLEGFVVGKYVEMPGKVLEGDPDTGTEVTKYIHATNETGWEHDGVITSNHNIIGGVITFTVLNELGVKLPHTGGMGTYIFTIGGILIIGAALLLISKKKKIKE